MSHASPKPAIAAVCLSSDLTQVLLIQRGKPPAEGMWTFPGGLLESGETLIEGCKREVFEETGLRIEPRDVVRIVERIIRDESDVIRFHYVIHDLLAIVAEYTEPIAATDAHGALWCHVKKLDQLSLTHGVIPVVERAIEIASGKTPSRPILEALDATGTDSTMTQCGPEVPRTAQKIDP